MTTTAICIKASNLRKKNYNNFREWLKNKNNVYVGRYGRIFIDKEIFHYIQSKWYNPYKLNKEKSNINEVLLKYLNHLFTSGLIFEIEELRGKTLGCFCEHQHKNKKINCHAQLLVDILEKCNHILQKIIKLKDKIKIINI